MSATEQCQQFPAYAVCLPLSSAFEFFKLCLVPIVNIDTASMSSERTMSKTHLFDLSAYLLGILVFLMLMHLNNL